MTDPQDDLDRRLRELEREKREEELRQLRASARARWITPTALAALLPLIAGFGLWVVSELKQYNEGYRALQERASLQREKEALQAQKDSLNIEIATLLQLKEHYAGQARQLKAEVEAKQDAIDKSYLRALSMGAETVYALDHVKGLGPAPGRKKLDAIRADIKRLPTESAAAMEDLLQRYDLMATIIGASSESARALHKALALVPVSDWARQLRAEPAGATFPGRRVMFTDGPEGRRYYDVMEGRFLTADESKAGR